MKFIKILNPENATEDDIRGFIIRTAVRAIVYDENGYVAILNVSKKNYYKLPGGGVEKGEDVPEALKRECKEELGCDVEIYGELGEILEYRKMFNLQQISPCYLARVVGKKGTPEFTKEEASDGFKIKWLPLNEALNLFDTETTEDEEGKLYIVPRDSTFILEAIKAST